MLMQIGMIINNVLIKFVCLCYVSLLLTACQQEKITESKHQLYVFGTMININIWHANNDQTQAAIDEISSTFNAMHTQWHAWKPGRLQDINHALRAGESVTLNQEEVDFIQQTINQALNSKHLFNPVIGELIHLWGFHTDDYPIESPPPNEQDINELIEQNISVNNLHLVGSTLSSDNPHVWLDFGGIAKGYAVDRAVEILQRHGINNAIINAGGDLRSIGNKGFKDDKKQPWRIAIQSPTLSTTVAEIEIIDDESVFTSGNYRRYKEFDGKRYSHIIHPVTGRPMGEIVSATVITKTGIHADAAATALIVAGSEHWYETAKDMNIKQALVINEAGQCQGTQAMIERLQNLSIDCQTLN